MKDFLIGVSTAAHQIEGNNKNNDWWLNEQSLLSGECSGDACKSYELYKKDRELVCGLNCNAYRFSIEWSRIEPVEGIFDQSAIEHYRDLINDLNSHGITPVITLHHFTNPIWFEEKGSWVSSKSSEYFLKFVEKVVNEYKDSVKWWVTFNEPNIYVLQKYLRGTWHPRHRIDLVSCARVYFNMINSHKKVYRLIHQVYEGNNVNVGMSLNTFIPVPRKTVAYIANYLICKICDYFYNHYFFLRIKKYLDFIGLNYYSKNSISLEFCKKTILTVNLYPKAIVKNDIHYNTHAVDLPKLIKNYAKYNLPVLITENGIGSPDDEKRVKYLNDLKKVLKGFLLNSKVKILGYMYWSLMDNYEWDFGFKSKFGLYSVNPDTFERIPKQSVGAFKELVQEINKI